MNASAPRVGAAVVVVAVVWLLLPLPARAVPALALAGVAPGAAIVWRVAIADRVVAAVTTLALSLSVTTVVAVALLYAGAWSSTACAVALGVVTVMVLMAPPLGGRA